MYSFITVQNVADDSRRRSTSSAGSGSPEPEVGK